MLKHVLLCLLFLVVSADCTQSYPCKPGQWLNQTGACRMCSAIIDQAEYRKRWTMQAEMFQDRPLWLNETLKSEKKISKIRIQGYNGTWDQNADIREFEFVFDSEEMTQSWGRGDRNVEISVSTNLDYDIYPADISSEKSLWVQRWVDGVSCGDGCANSPYIKDSDSGTNIITPSYYIDFSFVGENRPSINSFIALKWFWDREDMSSDEDFGTWSVLAYFDEDNFYDMGLIRLEEVQLVSGNNDFFFEFNLAEPDIWSLQNDPVQQTAKQMCSMFEDAKYICDYPLEWDFQKELCLLHQGETQGPATCSDTEYFSTATRACTSCPDDLQRLPLHHGREGCMACKNGFFLSVSAETGEEQCRRCETQCMTTFSPNSRHRQTECNIPCAPYHTGKMDMAHCEASICLHEYQARDIYLCQQNKDCPQAFLKYDEQTNKVITAEMEKYQVEKCQTDVGYTIPKPVQKNMIYPWYQGDASYFNITLGVGNEYGGISDLYMYFFTSMTPTKITQENRVLSFEMPQERPWMSWRVSPSSSYGQRYSLDNSFLSQKSFIITKPELLYECQMQIDVEMCDFMLHNLEKWQAAISKHVKHVDFTEIFFNFYKERFLGADSDQCMQRVKDRMPCLPDSCFPTINKHVAVIKKWKIGTRITGPVCQNLGENTEYSFFEFQEQGLCAWNSSTQPGLEISEYNSRKIIKDQIGLQRYIEQFSAFCSTEAQTVEVENPDGIVFSHEDRLSIFCRNNDNGHFKVWKPDLAVDDWNLICNDECDSDSASVQKRCLMIFDEGTNSDTDESKIACEMLPPYRQRDLAAPILESFIGDIHGDFFEFIYSVSRYIYRNFVPQNTSCSITTDSGDIECSAVYMQEKSMYKVSVNESDFDTDSIQTVRLCKQEEDTCTVFRHEEIFNISSQYDMTYEECDDADNNRETAKIDSFDSVERVTLLLKNLGLCNNAQI